MTRTGTARAALLPDALWDGRRAIGGPVIDALCFWGAPVFAALLVWLWADLAMALPQAAGEQAMAVLAGAVGLVTFAHLIAAAPRAYLNHQVFAANRWRLTLVPPLLIAALFLSPTALVIAIVLAVFWDVHHSALQTFGLTRIYDVKAGNDPGRLRRLDLAVNYLLFVGPILAGASLAVHLQELSALGTTPLRLLAEVPGLAAAQAGPIRTVALIAWGSGLALAVIAYAAERRRGYRMPAHKSALLISTATVSMFAWGLSPPVIAFAIINLYHAVQYFALVWLKEGDRMGGVGNWPALMLFLLGCLAFGGAYVLAQSWTALLAPFVACSLLHFWFDSFIWSVRKRQVSG